MTALQIVREIALALGLETPQTLTNANDQNAQRVLGLLNRALDAAGAAFAWQNLQKQITFRADVNSDAYNPQSGGMRLRELAPDFSAALTPRLYEAASAQEALYLSPDEFTRLSVRGTSCAGGKYFSLMGGEICFLPGPENGGWKCIMRYLSKYPVCAQDGARKRYFDADADETLLDEELLILGGVYKFKQEMGYDYADAQADYEQCLARLKAADGYAPVLYGADPDAVSSPLNVPESGAGGAK